MSPPPSNSTSTLTASSTISNELLQQVIKENSKVIAENLKDVLGAADYIFEQGYLTRSDYNEIESIEQPSLNPYERSNAFIQLILTKENDVLDSLIEYLEISKDLKKNTSSFAAFLCEKLKSSKEKFMEKIGQHLSKTESLNLNPTMSKTPIDSTDFTMTLNGLKEICNKLLKRNDKVHRSWLKVISNVNGLESLDLFKLKQLLSADDDEDEEDLFPSDRPRKNSPNYWEEIIMTTLTLWKERNGPNATFFSLLGILQESRLYDVADILLDMKDEIQKAPTRKP